MKNYYIFLDFDGVINTLIWKDGKCSYNFPADGKTNNEQAMCWLNELCRKTDAKIIVSSTWRFHDYERILRDSGLNKNVEIVGCTERRNDLSRTDEIKSYLKEHKEIENYVILDDEKVDDENAILINGAYGFGVCDMYEAIKKLKCTECIFK